MRCVSRGPRTDSTLKVKDPKHFVPAISRSEMWKAFAKAFAEPSDRLTVSRPLMQELMQSSRVFRLPGDIEDDPNSIKRIVGDREDILTRAHGVWDTFVLPFDVCQLHTPYQSVTFIAKCPSNWHGGAFHQHSADPGLHGQWMIAHMGPYTETVGVPAEYEDLVVASLAIGIIPIYDTAEARDGINFEPAPFEILGLTDKGDLCLLWTHGQSKRGKGTAPNRIDFVGGPSARGDDAETAIRKQGIEALGGAGGMTLDFFVTVQQPRSLIVELAPELAPRRVKQSKKQRRRGLEPRAESLAARPVYICLTRKELPKVLGLSAEAGQHRHFYGRRAHMRYLSPEKFRWKGGKTIAIAEIKPETGEGKTGDGREYRIRTDLPSPAVIAPKKEESE